MDEWWDFDPDHRPSSSAVFVRPTGEEGHTLVWIFEVKGLGVIVAREETTFEYPPKFNGLSTFTCEEIKSGTE